jgi:CheY-like chemotaxis protein
MSVLVLVVDDEPDVEELFRHNSGETFARNVSSWSSPYLQRNARLRIAEPIEQTLILILSDINMPGMTGLEMLPKARAMRPDVPIVMITA